MPEKQQIILREAFKDSKLCVKCNHTISHEHRVDEEGNIWCSGDKFKCKCAGL